MGEGSPVGGGYYWMIISWCECFAFLICNRVICGLLISTAQLGGSRLKDRIIIFCRAQKHQLLAYKLAYNPRIENVITYQIDSHLS